MSFRSVSEIILETSKCGPCWQDMRLRSSFKYWSASYSWRTWVSSALSLNVVCFPFLPRDAMHKRGLYRRAVCLSVRLSVTFVYCVKTSNQMINLFSPSDSHTILVFLITKRCYGNIPTKTPNWSKIAILNQCLALGSITAGVSSVINNFDCGLSL